MSNSASAFGAKQLEHFRASKQRLPLHPREKAVLISVAVHLCFLPWALGTMHVWSQLTSLGLATFGFLLALLPRTYSGELAAQLSALGSHPPGSGPQVSGRAPVFTLHPWARLVRFPIFWIGAALLGYIALQASNPSWVWERNATTWWLRRVNDIPWLPTSIDTPFERFNLWRQFIIYASAWLTVCTVWIGFTRRHTLQLLLIILAVNSAIFAIAGFARMIVIPESNWVLVLNAPLFGATPFASFIYKNHAGAYLALCAGVALMLATVSYQRGIKSMARSDPSMLWLLLFAILGFAVFFTYSRGAMFILAAYAVTSLGIHLAKQVPAESSPGSRLMGWIAVVIITLATLGYGARQLNYQRTTQSIASLVENREKDASVAARLEAYKAGQAMLEDYWLRGVGAGGFRYMFPDYVKHHPAIYKGGQLFWEHLHRDWYQLPIELGLFGCVLFVAGASWTAVNLLRNNLWQRPAVLILVLGCTQPLLQAWFDFPFQNPAVLLTWGSLIVLAIRWSELESA